MGTEETIPAVAPVTLDEVKAFLRIESGAEDSLLAGLVRNATALCESFTGLALITRTIAERVAGDGCWHRLSRAPVRAITGADIVEAGQMTVGLPASAYAVDIDAEAAGWVRIGHRAGTATIHYTAGIASDWNLVPEPLRQGIIRLAGYLFTERDRMDGAEPPAAVTALWQPWRRVVLR